MTHQRILFATDFSEPSAIALTEAARLAIAEDAELIVVHVFDPAPFTPPVAIPSVGGFEDRIAREIEESVLAELERLRKGALADVPKVRIMALRHGSPSVAVGEAAEEHDVDLIVVGTHGRTGLKRMLIGSVAEKIVRHAPCSVLAVRT